MCSSHNFFWDCSSENTNSGVVVLDIWSDRPQIHSLFTGRHLACAWSHILLCSSFTSRGPQAPQVLPRVPSHLRYFELRTFSVRRLSLHVPCSTHHYSRTPAGLLSQHLSGDPRTSHWSSQYFWCPVGGGTYCPRRFGADPGASPGAAPVISKLSVTVTLQISTRVRVGLQIDEMRGRTPHAGTEVLDRQVCALEASFGRMCKVFFLDTSWWLGELSFPCRTVVNPLQRCSSLRFQRHWPTKWDPIVEVRGIFSLWSSVVNW